MPGSGYPILQVWIDFEHGPFETATETWTEVTDYVRGNPVQISYGRDSQVDDFQPGQCRFSLANDDGIFDPANSSSPYYGKLKPRRRVKVTSAQGLFYGFVTGWPQRRESRNVGWVDITAVDALALLAQMDMPESVWWWRVHQHIDADRVTAWWRMGYDTEVATDSSGSENHGTFRVWENSNDPAAGLPAPKVVMAAGKVDTVIPSTEQPGTNFALLQAEVGQPLGGTGANTPRTVSLVGPQASGDVMLHSWTIEVWGVFRQAFPVNVTGAASSTTPVPQPVIAWGRPGGVRWELSLHSSGGYPIWYVYNEIGAVTGWGLASVNLYDGAVHQIALTFDEVSFDLNLYVDGAYQWTIGTFVATKPFWFPAVVNAPSNSAGLLESTLGDVLIYDTALSSSDVSLNWYAGRYGRLVTLPDPPTTNVAISQAIGMLNLPGLKWTVHYIDGKTLDSGITGGQTVLDYLRKVNASEQGLMYVDGGGMLRFYGRNWPAIKVNGMTPKGVWIDYAPLMGTEYSFSEISFRDGAERVRNDVTVTFPGGQQRATDTASQADYGPVAEQIDTLLADPEDALQLAKWRVWRDGQPPTNYSYPDRIVIEPSDNDFLICEQLDIGMVMQVGYSLLDLSHLIDNFWVQSINHEIEPGRGLWRSTFGIAPALQPAPPFIFDSSTFDGIHVLWT